MAFNDDVRDKFFARQFYLTQMERKASKDVLDILLNKMLPNIAKRIGTETDWKKLTDTELRLYHLRKSIREGTEFNRLTNYLFSKMDEVSIGEAQWYVETLQSLLPVAFELNLPAPTLMQSIVQEKPFNGKIMSEWFEKLNVSTQRNLYDEFQLGMIEGKTVPDMAGSLLSKDWDAFTYGGINRAMANATAVARTAINHASTQARQLTMKQNEDIINGVQYIATLDDRTSYICMSLDGQVFGIDEGPRPPMHYNCRSTIIPVVKSWEELGIDANEISASTRASMNGQVSETVDYENWLKDQDEAFQNKALGPARANLWRSGELSLQDMIGADYKPITLDDLGYTLSGKPKE